MNFCYCLQSSHPSSLRFMPAKSIQSQGGKARAEALTKEELIESAKKAAQARWGLPKATHEGVADVSR